MAKRKRAHSQASTSSRASTPSRLAPDVINPLSHTPSTLKQLAVAGHPEHEALPSTRIRHFPHRPLPADRDDGFRRPTTTTTTTTTTSSNDDNDDDDDDGRKTPAPRQRVRGVRRHQREADVLAVLARGALAAGDVAGARRAFALYVGGGADLRAGAMWQVGAEIIMRGGEGEGEGEGEEGVDGVVSGGAAGAEEEHEHEHEHEREHERGPHLNPVGPQQQQQRWQRWEQWGRPANLPALRAFYMALITAHPPIRHMPHRVSALHFWPALLGCEVYHVWAAQRAGRRRAEPGSEAESDPAAAADDDDDEDDRSRDHPSSASASASASSSSSPPRQRRAEDRVRLAAQAALRDIAARMDDLMREQPYGDSTELLRLRGMVALYMGDLAVGPGGAGAEKEEERERARRMFRKMVERGGHVDGFVRRYLDEEEGEEEDGDGSDDDGVLGIRMFSSQTLPLR